MNLLYFSGVNFKYYRARLSDVLSWRHAGGPAKFRAFPKISKVFYNWKGKFGGIAISEGLLKGDYGPVRQWRTTASRLLKKSGSAGFENRRSALTIHDLQID